MENKDNQQDTHNFLQSKNIIAANTKEDSHPLALPKECLEQEVDSAEFVHAVDIAEHIENMPLERQVCVLKRLAAEDAEDAADTLAELDDNTAVDVLENLDPDVAAQIIAEMAPDDAADVLDELEEDHRNMLLGKLGKEDSEGLRRLLAFDPSSAAGVMNTEVLLIDSEISVDDAIMQVRSQMEYKENPYYAYVVDRNFLLIGVLSLRDLMLAKPGKMVRETLGSQPVISVHHNIDKSEVAKMISRYNFMAIPVIDYDGHIMGAVTHDDIMDIIHEEASADMLGMVGAHPDETVDTPWFESVKKRLPWLLINLFNSALSASVVYMFEGSISQMAVLAVLMPMVANQAGNTGQQALAVLIRQLATERFDHKKSWMAVLREGKIGFTTGTVMALVAFLAVWAFSKNATLALVMSGALLFDMCLGAVAGGSIPLVFRALGRDPAQASSIFLTTITDGAGFFIFLGLATAFLL